MIRLEYSTNEHKASAYEIGQWCFTHDEECPFTEDHDVSEWYCGWLDMSSKLIDRIEQQQGAFV